jgi:predicted lipid-binding transport protein (Tim44 family)
MIRYRLLIVFAAVAAVLALVTADANARAGGGFSGGSRGMRTFSAPPATRTAPTTAAPIQRTVTQPRAANTVGQASTRPGLFGGGLFGGLAAGFIGAGLFGLLFGHGFFGGMGGLASVLGLILQIALIVIVARLLFAWWQRRQMPAPAYAGANRATGHSLGGLGSMFVGGTSSGEPLTIGKPDYDSFEGLLGEIQSAYSAEDINALRTKVTPEMLSYFSEQLAENASRGLVNKIDGVRLEQGDLSESWREGQVEYATVAMRFGLTDRMADRVTGRTVEGGTPVEATELWTFMRAPGGKWVLSAIQQT